VMRVVVLNIGRFDYLGGGVGRLYDV
jgi:hypothetical protein